MADSSNYGQDAAKAFNDSVKQPSQYNQADQGSGPSVPSKGPGNPVYGTSIVNGQVVQDAQPTYRSFASDQAAQQANIAKTNQEMAAAKKSNDAYAQIGTNVVYTRAKNAVGKPAPTPKKKGK